jgi:hypothetical protein
MTENEKNWMRQADALADGARTALAIFFAVEAAEMFEHLSVAPERLEQLNHLTVLIETAKNTLKEVVQKYDEAPIPGGGSC